MTNKAINILRDNGIEVKSLDAHYNKFFPKDSNGELIEGLLVVALENGKYINIVSTYNSTGTTPLVLESELMSEKGTSFDYMTYNAIHTTCMPAMLDENEIDLDELIEAVWAENDKPLPAWAIKGVHLRFKLNDVEIPDFMEVEELDNQETRFAMTTDEQYKWMSELLDVDKKYLREFEYITLYREWEKL